ncbi:hypothetical protein NIES593_08265 [Hydrococcus rivularis NIES-593]|uniref:Uncharacterized protein n=1 Tax=Hydrococcus rivularis NIES-593 TaxID=1921803 RepID=A0A1U7HKM7_9CYAN|nr:hypothetical protein NIES593_08265 [Hydrococcus rivularis NIES-593]
MTTIAALSAFKQYRKDRAILSEAETNFNRESKFEFYKTFHQDLRLEKYEQALNKLSKKS